MLIYQIWMCVQNKNNIEIQSYRTKKNRLDWHRMHLLPLSAWRQRWAWPASGDHCEHLRWSMTAPLSGDPPLNSEESRGRRSGGPCSGACRLQSMVRFSFSCLWSCLVTESFVSSFRACSCSPSRLRVKESDWEMNTGFTRSTGPSQHPRL